MFCLFLLYLLLQGFGVPCGINLVSAWNVSSSILCLSSIFGWGLLSCAISFDEVFFFGGPFGMGCASGRFFLVCFD